MNNSWHSNISSKNREDIVSAAKGLFLKNNFINVRIADICTEAGVSRVTFYKNFKSIDEVIFEVQINIMKSMNQFIREGSDFTGTGKESLKSVLNTWINFAKAHKDEMKFIVFFDLFYSSYDMNEELKSKYKEFTVEDFSSSTLKFALEKGLVDGTLKSSEDSVKTGAYIYIAVMGMLQRLSCTNFELDGLNVDFHAAGVTVGFDDITAKIADIIIRYFDGSN